MRHTPYQLAFSIVLGGLILIPSLNSSKAFAQADPSGLPGLIAPSATEQDYQQKFQKRDKYIQGEEEKIPEVKLEAPTTPSTVEVQTTQFTLNKVIVENAALLSDDDLREITAPFEGKEVSLADLQLIADKINKVYRDQGYLTTQAYIPPQDIVDGVVTIKVIEGRVGKLCVVGNSFNRTRAVLRNIETEPGDRFNLKQLEKDLNRTNQFNTNYRVRATLSPGEETGETDVKIDVAEKQPWQISPTFDNQGRPFIGTLRGGAELTNDSLFGWGDRLFLKGLFNDRTQVGLGSYFFPIAKRGDQLGISAGYSHVSPEIPGAPGIDINGSALNLGVLWTHPFDENRYWVGDVGFNIRSIRSETNDVTLDQDLDNIRSIQLGLNFNRPDRLGSTYARLQSTIGIAGILGGDRAFWKNEALLTRFFTLPAQNLLVLRAYGQMSPGPLPSAELLQIGGAYSVRGYSEGALLGDGGYTLTAEDRFPIPLLDQISPWLAERVQGVAFFDIGQAWHSTNNVLFSGGDPNLMIGVGVGLRARLTQYLQGFLDVGWGLINRDSIEPLGAPMPRIHFGIRSDLLPVVYKQRNDKPECLVKVNKNTKVSNNKSSNSEKVAATQPNQSQGTAMLSKAFVQGQVNTVESTAQDALQPAGLQQAAPTESAPQAPEPTKTTKSSMLQLQ